MQGPVNLALIAITVVVSMAAMGKTGALLLWPPAVTRHRQYWRFLTYGFVHADFAHLLFNMFTLYFFGQVIERFYGDEFGGLWAYPLFYLSALVVSALPSYRQHRDDEKYATLGASGAVSAVLFSFVLLHPWQTIYVYVIPVPAIVFAGLYTLYSVWMNHRGGDRVNHNAHLAGAAYGVMCTLLVDPAVLGRFLAAMRLG